MVEVENRTTEDGILIFGWRSLLSALRCQRVLYLLSGAMTAVIYCTILELGLLAVKNAIPYVFLLVVCHFTASVIVYPWYRVVVFRVSDGSWLMGYMRFYVVGLGFLAASVVGVPIMVEFAGLPIILAQSLVIVLSPPLGYVAHRTWTFRDRGKV
jgi:hypothetical protein